MNDRYRVTLSTSERFSLSALSSGGEWRAEYRDHVGPRDVHLRVPFRKI